MSASTLRIFGFLVLLAAVLVAILNLKRVANLGMLWLTPVLLIVGFGVLLQARRSK